MSQPNGPSQIIGDLTSTTPAQQQPAGSPPLPLPTTGPVQTTQGAPAPAQPSGAPPAPAGIPTDPQQAMAAGRAAATASLAQSHTGKGYEVNIDGLAKQINDIQDILDGTLYNVNVPARVDPPGNEYASRGYAEGAGGATAYLTMFNQHHEGITQYLRGYVQALGQVRDAYQRQDHEALDALAGLNKEKD
ncbi:hypothetical protein HFP15_21250 [Amycolatopsis sp. K13G38]|uniref:PE domain-containing protein n=1 Tax=Amycolatopsis acididurans TaxID=2724524 RepID=A0ABX1J759_9PSEU|nr:hypothetical protein [Amycolatopsis acididurans]NKQ55414.1 hypothetical protein [Amycolatopsis acididurans]